MFAATRSKRPIFAPARPQGAMWKKIGSFLATSAVIAFATWGGVLIAQELGGSGRTNNGLTRWINRWIDQLLAIDPILAGVLATLAGFVCLAWFIRDHN